MKQLLFSLKPGVYNKWKGVQQSFDSLAIAIAVHNGLDQDLWNDNFIRDISKKEEFAKINFERIDDSTYYIGHLKSKEYGGYVTYGTITKINVL